jgi:hypothetical protein
MSEKCYACSKPIDKSFGPSAERNLMRLYKELAPAGVCYMCKKGFCKDHFGYEEGFYPDDNTIGQTMWCLACVNMYDDEIEEDEYKKRVQCAREWQNFLWWPVGLLVGLLVVICIRGSETLYFGTRLR